MVRLSTGVGSSSLAFAESSPSNTQTVFTPRKFFLLFSSSILLISPVIYSRVRENPDEVSQICARVDMGPLVSAPSEQADRKAPNTKTDAKQIIRFICQCTERK